MSKFGTKYTCWSCGAKFYDLNKPEPICPKCDADQRDRPKTRAGAPPKPPEPAPAVAPMVPAVAEEEEDEVEETDERELELTPLDDDARSGFMDDDTSSGPVLED